VGKEVVEVGDVLMDMVIIITMPVVVSGLGKRPWEQSLRWRRLLGVKVTLDTICLVLVQVTLESRTGGRERRRQRPHSTSSSRNTGVNNHKVWRASG
jgi:hypothetical protein